MQFTKQIQGRWKNVQPYLLNERNVVATCLVLGLLLHSQGHCNGAVADAEAMNQITKSVTDTIFAPWVRKSALVFGGGMGLFQSWSAGSIKPLLVWGGLGLAVSYIPKLVEVISKVGT